MVALYKNIKMNKVQKILMADARYKEAMAELDRIKNIEDEEERQKGIQKASRLIISVAYDRAEVYELLAFTLLSSADILLRTSAGMLEAVRPNVKFSDKYKLNDAMGKIKKVIDTFEEESCKFHQQYFEHGAVEGCPDLVPYDAIEENARTMLRFLMFIYNALCQNHANAVDIEKHLRDMVNEKQIFSIEEIETM